MNAIGQEGTTQAVVAPVSSQAPREARDRRTWLVAIPLALIVIYAFTPALDNGFSPLDDGENFLDNPYFRGLGAAQVKWAWTTFWLGAYQPLAWMLLETQYAVWQLNPRGYHLISLLLQVANAVVLYFLTVALLVRCRTESCLESPWTCSLSAGLATALFAVHPLRVEAVAWASCQPYLPCILFSMLSVLAYLRAFWTSSSPRWGWLVGSFLLFVAALLFKAPAVSLPAVLLILDGYPLRRFEDGTGRWSGASARRALLEKVPFVLTSLVFMGLAIAAKPQSRFPVQHDNVSVGIARACYGTGFYILKTVLPLDLTAFYPFPRDLNWLALPFSLSILATLAISAGLFLLRRRWPGLLAAWLSYLVILVPNSGIIWISNQLAADRYSYAATLGSVMLAAAGFCWLWRTATRWHRGGAIGIIAIGLGALLGLTAMARSQCRTWLDAETLWAHALAHGANSSDLAHNNLGVELSHQGKYEAAMAHFNEALRLDPGCDSAHYNIGNVLHLQKKFQEAVAHYTEALRLNPANYRAHNNVGNVLYAQGKHDAAAAHFTEALRLNPGYAEAHMNLGTILSHRGKYEAAEAHFAEAAWLHPGDDKARNNLGKVLYTQGKDEGAVAQFTEALRLNPGFADAHNNLAVVLDKQGKYEAAVAHFTEALRLNPNLADAHDNLGTILSSRGKYAEAETHYAEVARLRPGDEKAHNNLGKVLFKRGKYEAAAAHFTEALRLNPGSVDAHYNLGLVFSHLGKYEAARAEFAEATRLQPGDPRSYNAAAMIMAACPAAKFRDGKKAVQFATRACELTKWKNPIILDTFAAAQAEAGDFDAAAKSQESAIELLTDKQQKDDYRSRLVLYQAKRPYRQVSPRIAPTGHVHEIGHPKCGP